jgi:RNA polymerase sigma-70 factor (ECF subfamily)
MQPDSSSLQDLLARAAQGDHGAFARVYERTHTHLFGVALRILGREHAAEDVLQEAFVNVWRNAASYRSSVGGQEIQPMTWLIAIVRNKALDALRSRKRRSETELPEADALEEAAQAGMAVAPGPADLLSQAVQALGITACMNTLDGSHRQALALAYYQGLTHNEVAAHMGAPLGSVKAWIRRGLGKLKACLAARGTAP